MIENLTPIIPSSQEIGFEILSSLNIALNNPAIPLLPSTPPNSSLPSSPSHQNTSYSIPNEPHQ